MSESSENAPNPAPESPGFSRSPELGSYEDELQQQSRRNRMRDAITRAPDRLGSWVTGAPQRVDRYTSNGRLDAIDGLSEDFGYYVAEERPTIISGDTRPDAPRNKERSDTTTMIANSISHAVKLAGATLQYSEADGRYHLEREVHFGTRKPAMSPAPDQPNMTFYQRNVNRFRGKDKFSNTQAETHLWSTLSGLVEQLQAGVDMNKWSALVHPDSVKELRAVLIGKTAEKGGDPEVTLANIRGRGLAQIIDSPALFMSYFNVSEQTYMTTRNKAELIPENVYHCIDTMLKLPDAQLDLLGEVAGPVPTLEQTPQEAGKQANLTLMDKVNAIETEWKNKYQKVAAPRVSLVKKTAAQETKRIDVREIRRRDAELKIKEQELRARELAQREQMLALRQQAIDNGDFDTAARLNVESHREERSSTEDWKAIASDPQYADLFQPDALSKLYTSINDEVRPIKDARLAELNEGKPEEEEITKLPPEDYGEILTPISDKAIERYLAGKSVPDSVKKAIKLAMLDVKNQLKRHASGPKPRDPKQTN